MVAGEFRCDFIENVNCVGEIINALCVCSSKPKPKQQQSACLVDQRQAMMMTMPSTEFFSFRSYYGYISIGWLCSVGYGQQQS